MTSILSHPGGTVSDRVRALIVEGDSQDAYLIRDLLEDAFPSGIEVQETRTVDETEATLAEWSPDVVLQDLGLLNVEAIDGVTRVVAAASDIPVIVFTGSSDEALGALAVHCGAHDHLPKGITSPEVLRRSVQHAVERRAANEALRDVEARYRLVVEAAQEGVWILDSVGITTFANTALATMLGCAVADIIGSPISRFLEPEERQNAARRFSRRRGGESERFECRMTRSDGARLHVEVRAAPIMTTAGFQGATGLVTDITARKRAEERLQFQAMLLDAVGHAVYATDRSGAITYWNKAASQLLGWSSDEAIGEQLVTLARADLTTEQIDDALTTIAGGNEWSAEMTIHHRSGASIPVMASLVPVYGDGEALLGAIGVTVDLSERRGFEESLAFHALHDDLTGLPNRRLFVDHVEHSLSLCARSGLRTAVLAIDLDDFKGLNDRYGHSVADEVLRAVGEVLAGSLCEGEMVARLGGDEFVVCYGDLEQQDEWLTRAQRILELLETPFDVGADTFSIGASVGAALSGNGATAEQLLRRAKAAMYAAKQAGRGGIELFDDELHEELRGRKVLAGELLAALDAGEIETFFQPEVVLRTGELAAFEALARWTHPARGPVSPEVFIPIAEDAGLIGRLGEEVLRASCSALASWIAVAPDRPVSVSVNVSGKQLSDPAFPDVVEAALLANGVPAGRVCLEITESAMASHDAALVALRRLKALGVKIAIDDFGTGYSSLSRLHQFPLDFIKIDRSFVTGMTLRGEDAAIVSAVIDLAGSLGLATIAEGIEGTEHLATLAELGCEVGQGYLWSPAITAAEALALVERRETFADRAVPSPANEPVTMNTDGSCRCAGSESSLAILGHELRQPVTVLSGAAELLVESCDPDVMAWSAESVLQSSRRILSVLELVEDSASLDSGSLVLRADEFSVADLVSEALIAAGDRLGGAVVLDVEDVAVEGDLHRLVLAVSNLLVNCAKHAPLTPVEISAVQGEDVVAIHVRDHGPGVPGASVGTIFKRFGRGGTRTTGSGLGLYVARGIARAHGGHLRYRPADGGGAEFILELPTSGRDSDEAAAGLAVHRRHGVHFYRQFDEVAPAIAEELIGAARAGEAVLVVAAPDHRRSIEQALAGSGVLDSGRYVALDAADTLASFMSGEDLDGAAFAAAVGEPVAELSERHSGVTVFGEMVDLLWAAGKRTSAVKLEEAWNDLASRTSFSLICGYASERVSAAADMGRLARLHSYVQAC